MYSPLQAALSSLFRTTSFLGVTFDRCLNWPMNVRHIKTSALPSPTSSAKYVLTPVNAESYIFCLLYDAMCVGFLRYSRRSHVSHKKRNATVLKRMQAQVLRRFIGVPNTITMAGTLGECRLMVPLNLGPQELLRAQGIRLPRSTQLSH